MEIEPVLTVEALLKRTRYRVSDLLQRYKIPGQDLEDVVQEATLVMVSKWSEIRDKEAYLLSTLRFLCITYWRRKRGSLVQYHDHDTLEELAGPQEPRWLGLDLSLDFRRSLAGLGRKQGTLVWLRYVVGLDTSRVAALLGYEPSSIRKVSGRGLKKLRDRMQRCK